MEIQYLDLRPEYNSNFVHHHDEIVRDLLKNHLDRVSRSFAFCIARLRPHLVRQVSIAYLLCRILDSIEDANWNSGDRPTVRMEAYRRFIQSLINEAPPLEEDFSWQNEFTGTAEGQQTDLPEAEKELLRDASKIFRAFHCEAVDVREVLIGPIISMARGMQSFQGKKLGNLREVNRYCFFVAGVVGEMLSRLVEITSPQSLVQSFRFGFFLQKVNLLKDQRYDLSVGRDFVPSREAVFQSVLLDAEEAFSYLKSIPIEFEDYLVFCSWSFFLGLASLPHILRGKRISRIETFKLIKSIEGSINNPGYLERQYRLYRERLLKFRDVQYALRPAKVSDDALLSELKTYQEDYRGQASGKDLLAVIRSGFWELVPIR